MEPRNIILVFLILICLLILPVSAETLTGSLGGSGWNSTNYNFTELNGNAMGTYGIKMNPWQSTGGTVSIVHWDYPAVRTIFSPDTKKPSGQTSCNVTLGGAEIATCIIGYQRFWDNAFPTPNELIGYQWIMFSNWTPGPLTGEQTAALNYNHTLLDGMSATSSAVYVAGGPGFSQGYSVPGNTINGGLYTWNRDINFHNEYTAIKPSGIGITGYVNKTVGGSNYPSRVYIVDGTTGATLASDYTLTSNDFTFATTAQTIRIAVKSTVGDWYNSSTLFGVVTQSPTITPSPTYTVPPGTTWSNISLTVDDAINGTHIPNAYVKVERYTAGDHTSNGYQGDLAGYTDVNGHINLLMVPVVGLDHKFVVIKPGYFTYSAFLDPISPGSQTIQIVLSPDIGPNPEVPQFVNITVQIKSGTTFQPISGAYVSIEDTIMGTATQAQNTNASGYVYFPHFPATAYIGGHVTKTGYLPATWDLGDLPVADTSLVKYIYLTSSTVTPTITPQQQLGITLTAVPNSVNPGQSSVLTTTCSNATACTGAGGLKLAIYTEYVPSTPQTPWLSRVIGVYKYNTTSTGWDFRQNDTYGAWQVGSYNPLTITAYPYISGTYNYYVSLVNNQDQSLGTATTGVLVSGAVAGSLNMHMGASSGTTGSALQNFNMNLTTVATGTVEDFGLVPYQKVKALPRGMTYTLQCSKAGYIDGSRTFTVSTDPNVQDGAWGTYENCPMFPTGSISAGNTTVTVKAFDSVNFIPIPGVQISVGANPIYSSSPQYTGGQGEGVFFIIGQNTDYTITASKSGYCGVTETGNTGTLDTDLVDLYLKPGSCGGVTPTTTVTTIPGQTPSGVVTPTPFQPGNATSFWDPWVNVYRMMGANDSEIPNLIAGLIIILCMAAGAGMAGVLGAEIGMGFGAIFCVSIGLIPIWVVLSIIVLGFLFYGLKIGR